MFCNLGFLPATFLFHQTDHGEQLEAINLVVGKARFKVLLLLLGLEVTQARILAVADKAKVAKRMELLILNLVRIMNRVLRSKMLH
ncbi:hypothetical protein D3C81_703200 [compost metagenome]